MRFRGFFIVFLSCVVVAENIMYTNSRYQQRLITLPSVPATSYGHATLGEEERANKLFITFLFSKKNVGIEFLKDVGLLRSSMVCSVCGCQMSWCVSKGRFQMSM
jgi:hypothetical protein